MEHLFSGIGERKRLLKDYINTQVGRMKLRLADKISKFFSNIFLIAIVATMLLFFLGLASVAFAIALSGWTGEIYWGFLIVAGFYLILSFIVWLRRKQLLRIPIMNAIVRELFSEEEYIEGQ